MQKKVSKYFKIASRIAKKKSVEDKRTYFLGAIGLRSDGKMVKSTNGSTIYPVPQAHAEARLSNKLDVGSIVYVARVKVDGGLALAKPCQNCQAILKSKGVKLIYYTIADGEFGKINLSYGT